MGRKSIVITPDMEYIIRTQFPDEDDNHALAATLGLTVSTLKKKALELGIVKTDGYFKRLNARRTEKARKQQAAHQSRNMEQSVHDGDFPPGITKVNAWRTVHKI